MLRISLLSAFFFIAFSSFAQKTDFENIRSATNDSMHSYFYPKLIAEFVSAPEYFSSDKGTYLYYGQMYSKTYQFFPAGKEYNQLEKFIKSERYHKAIPVGEKLFAKNPVNLDLLIKLSHCYRSSGMADKARQMKNMVEVLLRAIRTGGDRPYKVTSVTDEYIIMGVEQLTGISRYPAQGTASDDPIPRTEVPGIRSILDSWQVKDNKTNETKDVHFEVLYNTGAISK